MATRSSPADRLSIGNDSHVEGVVFDESAAAVKLDHTVLTPVEIATEMASTPVRTAALNAWYPLQSAGAATTGTVAGCRTLTLAGALATDAARPAGAVLDRR